MPIYDFISTSFPKLIKHLSNNVSNYFAFIAILASIKANYISNMAMKASTMPIVILEYIDMSENSEGDDEHKLIDLRNKPRGDSGEIYLHNIGKVPVYNVAAKLIIFTNADKRFEPVPEIEFHKDHYNKKGDFELNIKRAFLNPNKKLLITNYWFNLLKYNLIHNMSTESDFQDFNFIKKLQGEIHVEWKDYYGKVFTIVSDLTVSVIVDRTIEKEKQYPMSFKNISIIHDLDNPIVKNPYM
ncbi:MAG: hypothetical protein GX666_03525 [Tissierellia bacterium]|nr:hypothetical protein [Tissierellia bacterium]